MKHESRKHGSPRRNKMMWLLRSSLLLLAVVIFLAIRGVSRTTTFLTYNEFNEGKNSQPYEKLSELLNEGKVGEKITLTMGNLANTQYFVYERKEKRLRVIIQTQTESKIQWQNVSENAMRAAAKREISGFDPNTALKDYEAEIIQQN